MTDMGFKGSAPQDYVDFDSVDHTRKILEVESKKIGNLKKEFKKEPESYRI